MRTRLRRIEPKRTRDERGSALIEFTWLGILLLVPLVYIMLSVFEVQRGAFAVSAAAAGAGRAFALADNDVQGKADAAAVARLALADQGLADAPLDLTITCEPTPGNCHSGGTTIRVTVRSQVVLPLLPSALGGNRPSFRLDATHAVPIGQFQEK
jgi:Flp pilus assembly protein TadG